MDFCYMFSDKNDSLNKYYAIALGKTLKTHQCPFFSRDVKLSGVCTKTN
jgi:hypothetical protein